MSSSPKDVPEHILSRATCRLDPFFSNQFDITHDVRYANNNNASILPEGHQSTLQSYGDIAEETQSVHGEFVRAENDAIKNLLLKNRQRALVYQKALQGHVRKVREGRSVGDLLSPVSPFIMIGRNDPTLQGNIEKCSASTIPYGQKSQRKPWFRRHGPERYPEDGSRATVKKVKFVVSAHATINSNLSDPKATSASKTSWNHGLSGGVFKLYSDSLQLRSFCDVTATLGAPCGTGQDGAMEISSPSPQKQPKSNSTKYAVAPVYIPRVRSVPKGRSWCSLSTNVVVEDQPVMHVAPYFGEDDREGIKVDPFDVAPDEVEPPITSVAAVETVRFLILKYTAGLSPDIVEKFIKIGLINGKMDADSDDRNMLHLHLLSENVMRSLCDTLSASYKQVYRLAKKAIAAPTTSPTVHRKPLYYVQTQEDPAVHFKNTISKRPEYKFLSSYDYFDMDGSNESASHPLFSFEHTEPTPNALSRVGNNSISGLAPLFVKADRSTTGLLLSAVIGQCCVAAEAFGASPAGHSTVQPLESGVNSEVNDNSTYEGVVSYAEFFRKNEVVFSAKKVNCGLVKEGSTDEAYNVLVESYQLLYCRRCFVFDCPLHKVELPVPRSRLEPPPLPQSHISGIKLPYESATTSSVDNIYGNPFELLKSPYCLYCSGSQECDLLKEWSVVEILFCLRLYDMYIAGEDGNLSLFDIAERIARCMRTRSVASVLEYLESLDFSFINESNSVNEGSERPIKRQKLSRTRSLKRAKPSKTMNTVLRPLKSGYDPCDHDGPCTIDNGCSCKIAGTNCEKYCGCSVETCGIRFEGCRCKAFCNTGACPCAASGRECDPELCGSCGASIHPMFIPGMQKDCADMTSYRMCTNVNLRRGERKRVAIGRSEVQGWGLFICEPAAKGELIIEYRGEVVSNDEAERRGVVYDKMGCSYLFDLANELVVDSTRLGNAVKFMNHNDEKTSNCFPEIKAVDGEQRIGLYARRPIAAGEELTFDYKYTDAAAPDWAKGKQSADSSSNGRSKSRSDASKKVA